MGMENNMRKPKPPLPTPIETQTLMDNVKIARNY